MRVTNLRRVLKELNLELGLQATGGSWQSQEQKSPQAKINTSPERAVVSQNLYSLRTCDVAHKTEYCAALKFTHRLSL